MIQRTLVLSVVAAAVVAGCAGREGNPVPITQSYDAGLSCEQMQAEITANETKARQLGQEDKSAHDSNVAIGVVGAILFWPALFALDVGDAEKEEMSALRQRNGHLATLMAGRGCGGVATSIRDVGVSPDKAASVVRAQGTSSLLSRWTGEGGADACGKPYAIDLTLSDGRARGTVRRGAVNYVVNAEVDQAGDLTNSLAAPAAAAASESGRAPANLKLNLDFADQRAAGSYSVFDGSAFSCETPISLERAS
jgi:hypothetical protein